VGLAWGFLGIAAIALVGSGRARVTAAISVVEQTDAGVILQIAASNEFGDRVARPVLNLLFGPGADVAGINPASGATFDAGCG
jgi:hypothetical protein